MKPDLLEDALEYTNKAEKPLFAQSYLERFCDKDPEMKRVVSDVNFILDLDDIEETRGVDLKSMLENILEI